MDGRDLSLKPKNCKGTYLVDSGFMKIPGNECKAGNDKSKSNVYSCVTGKTIQSPSQAPIVSG